MANTLRFKRGLLAGLPSAAVGEPLFTTDTFDLYIGTASGTQKYQKFIASGTTSQLLRGDGSLLTMPIVLTSPSNGQVLKYNGTSWVNDSDAGITGSGTTNYLPRFTGATTLGNSTIFQGTRSLGFNTATPVDFGVGSYNFNFYDDGIPSIQLSNSTTGQSTTSGMRMQANNNDLLFINNQATGVIRWLTNGAERMRLHSTGNLHLGGTSDNGLRFQVTGDGYFSGGIGIGTSSVTGFSLIASRNISQEGSYGIFHNGQIQTSVANNAGGFINSLQTAASTSLFNYFHYRAILGTIGAGTTITNVYGYEVANSTVGTNVYGYYGNIASGTGRWNLYMNGTANNYLAGNLGIGVTVPAGGIDVNNPRSYFRNSGSTGTAIRIISTFTNGRDWGIGGNYVGGNGEFSIYDYTANAERLQINASGNLGLGVTPSAWYTPSTSVLQIRHSSFYSQADGGNYYTFIGNNYFQDAGTFFKYINTGSATQYRQFNGQHIWYNAPSGSANATITFTQAMTLDASGNLLVGTTTNPGYGRQTISVYNSTGGIVKVSGTTTSALFYVYQPDNVGAIGTDTNHDFAFVTNNVVRARFSSSGNLLLGLASDLGYKLDVNGTMRVSGASTFARITATTSGVNLDFNSGILYHFGGSGDYYQFISGANYFLQNRTSTGYLALGTQGTTRLTIASDGAATFSSSVTATNLALDTTSANGSGRISLLSGGTRFGYIGTSLWALGEAGTDMTIVSVGGLRFATNDTSPTKLMLTTGGNLLIGTTTDAGYKLDVNGTMRVSGASTFGGLATISTSVYPTLAVISSNSIGSGMYLRATGTSGGYFTILSTASGAGQGAGKFVIVDELASATRFTIDSTGSATFSSSVTAASFIPTSGTAPTNGMYLNNTNSLAFSTNSTFRLVIGSTGIVGIGIANPSAGFGDGVGVEFAPSGYIQSYRSQGAALAIGRHTTTGSIQTFFYGTTVGSPAQIGAIGTDGTGLTLSGGAFGTTHLTIASSGAATFSSTISSTGTNGFAIGNLTNTQRIQYGSDVATSFTLLTAANAYAGLYAGAVVLSGNLTVDTNTLFVDSSANRVGVGTASPLYALHVTGDGYFGDNVRFPNLKGCVFVQTGGSLLGSIAMDSANAVTIDNNGFAGLSVGGSYTMTGGNLGIGHSAFGTSATKTISVNSGTAPSTSPADAFQLYSADITAGNAAPHFRTENGGIIKLYQQTTGVTSATYIGGAGTGLTDSDTFDGYTIAQIVKALRNAGLLA